MSGTAESGGNSASGGEREIMKLGKKDLPNLIALCIAAAVVGTGMMTGHAWPPSEPPERASAPPKVTSAARPEPPSDTGRAQRAQGEPAAIEAEQSAKTARVLKPIEPQIAPPEPVPAPRPTTARRTHRPSVSSAAVPPGELPPLLPPLGVPAADGSVPLSQPEVLRLAGIIKGEDARLALLRRGDRRYLVREGDTIDGVYRVTKIAEDRVVLQRRSRTQTLRLSQA